MSIRTVTMYEVVCDYPGCGKTTDDVDGEFAAWNDSTGAVERWESAGGATDERTDGPDKHRCPDHSNLTVEPDEGGAP